VTAEDAFDEVRAMFVGRPDVGVGRMFHCDGLTCGGKFFATLSRDDQMLVKLPAARVTELVTSGVSLPFDANKGRVMKEWTLVPYSSVEQWPEIAEEAYAFGQTLAARARR
jgi:hypothetical protein